MDDSPNIAKAHAAALRYLQQRPLSVGQLRNRLLRRGFSEVATDQAVAELVDTGDLGDQALALDLCEKAIKNGRGPRWIEQALTRREFCSDDINPCLELARSHAAAVAEAILRRRYGPVAQKEHSTRLKAARFLQGRGFYDDTIQSALETVLPAIE